MFRKGIATAALVLAVAGCSVPSAIVSDDSDPSPTTSSTTSAPSVTEGVDDDPTTEAPEPAPYKPKKSDVNLTLKQKSKECFGSAGCNLELLVRAAVDKTGVPQDGTLTVYFKLKGTEDPYEGSLELNLSDGTYRPDDADVQTTSSSKKVTVVVTSMEYTD